MLISGSNSWVLLIYGLFSSGLLFWVRPRDYWRGEGILKMRSAEDMCEGVFVVLHWSSRRERLIVIWEVDIRRWYVQELCLPKHFARNASVSTRSLLVKVLDSQVAPGLYLENPLTNTILRKTLLFIFAGPIEDRLSLLTWFLSSLIFEGVSPWVKNHRVFYNPSSSLTSDRSSEQTMEFAGIDVEISCHCLGNLMMSPFLLGLLQVPSPSCCRPQLVSHEPPHFYGGVGWSVCLQNHAYSMAWQLHQPHIPARRPNHHIAQI